jgi:bifunctional non-homologous end joining protein LigD
MPKPPARSRTAVEPMLATAASLPTSGAYGFELKWDGVRALAHCQGGRLRLTGRRGNDITGKYPEVQPLGAALGKRSATLDGEIVVLDDKGRPDFGLVQLRYTVQDLATAARRAKERPALYCIFDLMELDGEDLTMSPYAERRRILEGLGLQGPTWHVPPYTLDGQALLSASRELGLEGVVAKRLDSPYESGARSDTWLKVRNRPRQEFVVGGWSEGEGSRDGRIGSLLVGYWSNANGRRSLRYVGKVGSGLDDRTIKDLEERFAARARAACPFDPPFSAPGVHFVTPEVVVEVEASGLTRHGTLRQPAFKGIREDKPAHAVVWEQTTPAPHTLEAAG